MTVVRHGLTIDAITIAASPRSTCSAQPQAMSTKRVVGYPDDARGPHDVSDGERPHADGKGLGNGVACDGIKAGESMMAFADLPTVMAYEMPTTAIIAKSEALTAIAEHATMTTASGATMVTDVEIKTAIRKAFSDPAHSQALLQTMISREPASAMFSGAPVKAAPMFAS
ncbi:hypothetical protein [Neorhodopirellula pilleata]|uniref:Uncharacterized protein n=1 Tax=Neorhodopirellula pilleata TaxID=2714738 RepID=A0A5C6A0G5_9BACT|nr:hypothetical protein [Neorhodopirellula pilleata]TWT93059.1 hypothetical protein Pla100_43750 [Neorhodopirellula pilleata]